MVVFVVVSGSLIGVRWLKYFGGIMETVGILCGCGYGGGDIYVQLSESLVCIVQRHVCWCVM